MQMQWRLATRSTSNGAGARTNVQFNSSRMTLQSEGPRRTRCRMRCWASHVARRALPRDVQQLPRRVGGSTDGHTPCLSRHAWNSRLHAAAACASTQATHARRSRGAGRMPSLRGPCRAFCLCRGTSWDPLARTVCHVLRHRPDWGAGHGSTPSHRGDAQIAALLRGMTQERDWATWRVEALPYSSWHYVRARYATLAVARVNPVPPGKARKDQPPTRVELRSAAEAAARDELYAASVPQPPRLLRYARYRRQPRAALAPQSADDFQARAIVPPAPRCSHPSRDRSSTLSLQPARDHALPSSALHPRATRTVVATASTSS